MLCLFTFGLAAQSINTEASLVTFQVSNMKVNTVVGSVGGMTGTLTFDQDDLEVCEFDVCIDANTIKTGIEKRDEHLHQSEYFDTQNHPQICFASEMVKRSNNGYAVVGQLTMKGVSKSVMIPFTFDGTTFSGNLNLSRTDYGVGADTSTFLIGDEITIAVSCVVD